MPGELKAEYWRKKFIKNNIAKRRVLTNFI
jgi:hypothetical protein